MNEQLHFVRGLFLLLAAASLSACLGGQDYPQPGQNADLGGRPGLLSGAQGYFEFSIGLPPQQTSQGGDESSSTLPVADYLFN